MWSCIALHTQQQPVTINSTNIGIVHHNCRPTKNTTIKHHDPLCSYIAHPLIARTPSKPTPTSYPRSKWANTISMHNLGQENFSTSFCLFQKSSLRYFFLTRIHERGKQILPFEVYESLLEQFDKIALSEWVRASSFVLGDRGYLHFFSINDEGQIGIFSAKKFGKISLSTVSEGRLAQWASWFVRGWEPLVKTSWMKFMLAGPACKTWKAVVGSVDDTITYGAFLNSFEFLVEITLPYPYCFS